MNSTESDFYYYCHVNLDVYVQIIKFPSSTAFVNHCAACILSVFIILTTVILNSLTVLTFWRTPRLRKNVLIYLVMILSSVDAGNGIFCYPTLTVRMAYELMERPKCWHIDVQAKLFRISGTLTLSLVSAISIERYFGVSHPLIHLTKVTKSKLLQFLVLVWSICALPIVPSIFIDGLLNLIPIITCALLVLIIICAQTTTGLTVIHASVKREGLRQGNLNPERTDNVDVRKSRKEKLHILKQFRMAKSSFLISLCYFCCFMPTLLVLGVMVNELTASTRALASPWCLLLLMSNSCLNSIIFYWRNASLRKETMNVLKNIKVSWFDKMKDKN